jgi:hypothetical protein
LLLNIFSLVSSTLYEEESFTSIQKERLKCGLYIWLRTFLIFESKNLRLFLSYYDAQRSFYNHVFTLQLDFRLKAVFRMPFNICRARNGL